MKKFLFASLAVAVICVGYEKPAQAMAQGGGQTCYNILYNGDLVSVQRGNGSECEEGDHVVTINLH